jgi:hypothetical protein
MAEKLKELMRDYQEGRISRRDFMRQAVIATGSLAAANSLIGGLLPRDAYAAQVANDRCSNSQRPYRRGKPGQCWLSSSPVKADNIQD